MEVRQDQGKTVAILSYITLIGLIIAFVLHNDDKNKSDLGAFHLRQAIGIFATGMALSIAQFIFVFIPFLGWLINVALTVSMVALFVFWILGIISAINQEKKEVPFVGAFYQNLFSGIK
jgi:uncharacterized membrane protein